MMKKGDKDLTFCLKAECQKGVLFSLGFCTRFTNKLTAYTNRVGIRTRPHALKRRKKIVAV
jgi:hypothetical protein